MTAFGTAVTPYGVSLLLDAGGPKGGLLQNGELALLSSDAQSWTREIC